jgi:hypothetical protein
MSYAGAAATIACDAWRAAFSSGDWDQTACGDWSAAPFEAAEDGTTSNTWTEAGSRGGLGPDIADVVSTGGTFFGGAGQDRVYGLYGGTFRGGRGADWVDTIGVPFVQGGSSFFIGGIGRDVVGYMRAGTFDGGVGIDAVGGCFDGDATVNVENVSTVPCLSEMTNARR